MSRRRKYKRHLNRFRKDVRRAINIARQMGFRQFNRTSRDDYDMSVEFYGVPPEIRLSMGDAQKIMDAGKLLKIFINHSDGWETHYNHKGKRWWRRRYVKDESAQISNVIVGPPNPGYFEISYWPWGDKCREWLDTGYMRIVPDQLETVE